MTSRLQAMLGRPNAPHAQALLMIVSGAGGALMAAFGLPAAWLSGGMLAVALLAVANCAAPLASPLRRIAIVFAGAALGSAATPQMVGGFGRYPVSLIILGFAVSAIGVACTAYLVRLRGWTRETALFASVPGALSFVLTLAPEVGADSRRVAVVQVIRVFILVALLPPFVASSGVRLAALPTGPVDPGWILILLITGGLVAGVTLERLNIGSGMLLGAIAVSATLHATGVAPGRLPAWFQILGQVLVGAWTGARFVGFDWRLLGHSLAAALGTFMLSLLIAAGFAGLTTATLAIPFGETLVAFAPGAVEAMTVLAFALGLDPVYVGSHHLARFFFISVSLPFVVRFWLGAKTSQSR